MQWEWWLLGQSTRANVCNYITDIIMMVCNVHEMQGNAYRSADEVNTKLFGPLLHSTKVYIPVLEICILLQLHRTDTWSVSTLRLRTYFDCVALRSVQWH